MCLLMDYIKFISPMTFNLNVITSLGLTSSLPEIQGIERMIKKIIQNVGHSTRQFYLDSSKVNVMKNKRESTVLD